MSDEISELDHRFGLRDKQIESLEKKFEEIYKSVHGIEPSEVDGLKEQIAELKAENDTQDAKISKQKIQIIELKEQFKNASDFIVKESARSLDNREVLRELFIKGKDMQSLYSISIELLEKLDSDPVQNRIDRLDAGIKVLKKHEEALKDLIPKQVEGGLPYFKINCPFCEGNSVSDVIDSIEEVDGQWECSNGHQFVVKYLGKIE